MAFPSGGQCRRASLTRTTVGPTACLPEPLQVEKICNGFTTLAGKRDMREQVCFCFGYTVADIEADLVPNAGRSTILERIAAQKSLGGCHCAQKNPQGR